MIELGFIGPTGLMDRGTINCARTRNDSEFSLHEKTISQEMGLGKAELEDLKNPCIDDSLWPENEASLITMTDGLVQKAAVSDRRSSASPGTSRRLK